MRSLDQTPEGWDSASETYDAQVAEFFRPYAARCIELADVGREHKVLDLAAGTGLVTLEVAPIVDRVVAVDFAPRMVEALGSRATRVGLRNISVEVMSAEELVIPDHTFDRVICNLGAMFFRDRVKAFAEMYRVLRPGGRAVVSTWGPPERFQAFSLFVASIRRATPDLGHTTSPLAFALADPSRLRDEMCRGGFDEVRIETVAYMFEAPDAASLWSRLKGAAPPMTALLARVGPRAVEQARADMTATLRERFGDGPVRLPCEAHFAIATRVSRSFGGIQPSIARAVVATDLALRGERGHQITYQIGG